MNNQYWKSDNQISKGVSKDRINTYKAKVAKYNSLTWKIKILPTLAILLVLTFLVGGITQKKDILAKDVQDNGGKFVETVNTTNNTMEESDVAKPQRSEIVNGTTEDGLYEYNKNGDTIILTKYSGNEEEVTIPSEIDGTKVTVIGNGLFYGNNSVSSVIIPDTIVEIQDGITGGSAFGFMGKLQKVTISGSIKAIGSCAFINCKNLSEVTLEEGIEEIGPSAFEGCYDLKEITIPKSVLKLGTGCFFRTGITDITITPECEVDGEIFFIGTDGTINFYE